MDSHDALQIRAFFQLDKWFNWWIQLCQCCKASAGSSMPSMRYCDLKKPQQTSSSTSMSTGHDGEMAVVTGLSEGVMLAWGVRTVLGLLLSDFLVKCACPCYYQVI